MTTEFWLTLIVIVGGLLATKYAEAEWAQTAGMISGALAALGYGLGRSNVKRVEAAINAQRPINVVNEVRPNA